MLRAATKQSTGWLRKVQMESVRTERFAKRTSCHSEMRHWRQIPKDLVIYIYEFKKLLDHDFYDVEFVLPREATVEVNLGQVDGKYCRRLCS